MTDARIISEVPLSMADLHTEIKKIEKRDTTVNFRVSKVGEYLSRFLRLNETEYAELVKKLTALDIPRLKEQHIIKIADLMPTTAEDIKEVLQGYPLSISSDNIKKIAGVVREFVQAKKS